MNAEREVMRVSIAFLNQTIKLIDLFSFNFVMSVFLNFTDEIYTLEKVLL